MPRLFFALWPDDTVRAALLRARAALGELPGRPTLKENLHLTLAFLGATDPPRRACLEQAAAALRIPPFTLRLDRYGYWRRSQVLWLGCGVPPAPLRHLVGGLRDAQQACAVTAETRPYAVHLTLFRKLRKPPGALRQMAAAVSWPVRDFALVASELDAAGARYRVLRTWPLA